VPAVFAALLVLACGTSKQAADDEGSGSSGDAGAPGSGGSGGVTGGAGGGSGASNGGSSGASSAAGGSSGAGASGGTGGGDAGEPGTGGASTSGGSGGSGDAGGTGGSAGAGPRPPFSPRGACGTPEWLTSGEVPVETTNPVAATNASGAFVVAYHTSEEVNEFETWGDGVFLLDGGVQDPNRLESLPPDGSTFHTGQVSMGRTGDALWMQNQMLLGASRECTLRRWDNTTKTWDDPHVVSGLASFGMRSAFLNDHDILVVGPSATDIIAVRYDHAARSWSEPEIVGGLGPLGVAEPNWGVTHVSLAVAPNENAAVVWSNVNTTGARMMYRGEWVGVAVSPYVNAETQGVWDVAVAPAGSAAFELLVVPWHPTNGLLYSLRTLSHAVASQETTLSAPIEAPSRPEYIYNIGAGQPIAMARDIDGDLTFAGVFWTDRPEFWVHRRTAGIWDQPLLLASGNIVLNNDIGMGLQPLVIDSGGHVTALTANDQHELILRQLEKGSSTWTEGIRVDDAEHRFDGRGAALLLDENEEPVVFFSAQGELATNVAWTGCR